MTTIIENQSDVETLTTAVCTVTEAAQKLTEALSVMAMVVSTLRPREQASTTQKPTPVSSTEQTTKRKPGRPKAQTIQTDQTKTEPKTLSSVSEESSPDSEPKKRGASPEVLARARAVAKARREAKAKEGMGSVEEAVGTPPGVWPFPTSTKYNNDGSEKDKSSDS